jgi:hypothetical protein
VNEEKESQAGRLYSAGQVTGATAIGGPIAGAILLARNYSALGDRAASRKTLLWASAGTVAVFVIAYFLPESASKGLPIGYTVGMFHVAKQLQGDRFKSHIAGGGLQGSTWFAVGIGALTLVVIVALLAGVIVVGALVSQP